VKPLQSLSVFVIVSLLHSRRLAISKEIASLALAMTEKLTHLNRMSLRAPIRGRGNLSFPTTPLIARLPEEKAVAISKEIASLALAMTKRHYLTESGVKIAKGTHISQREMPP